MKSPADAGFHLTFGIHYAKGNIWNEIPSLDGSDNYATTRDYARYAKENGYDGVIIKNLYDTAVYASRNEDVPSDVVIAFESNQIKSVYNENPTENEDIRYALNVQQYEGIPRKYDYNSFNLDDRMDVYSLEEFDFDMDFDKTDRHDIYRASRENIKIYNQGNDHGEYKLVNKYIGEVAITKKGIIHGLKRNFDNLDADAAAYIPLYFESALPINEADGRDDNIEKAIILVGMYIDGDSPVFVILVINQENRELVELRKLYSINNKKENDADYSASAQSPNSFSDYRVKDFLNDVKVYFPNELSVNVADELGIMQGDSDIKNLRYSINIDDELDISSSDLDRWIGEMAGIPESWGNDEVTKTKRSLNLNR